MANLSKIGGRWVNLDKPGGLVIFVSGGTVAHSEGITGGGLGGSDSHRGLDPEHPKLTIQDALDDTTAGRGDTVVVLPGSITVTAAITMTKDDVTLTGYTVTGPKTRNPSVVTTTTNSIALIEVDAANCSVENLTLTPAASTADVYAIDVGDTTASPGTILKNLFLDMESSVAAQNGIRIGDGTVVSDYCLIEGCFIYDYDDIGINVSTASEGCVIRNCRIIDGVSANIGLTGINIAADHTAVENCFIKNSTAGASGACIEVASGAIENSITDTHLIAFGSGGHGLHITASGSVTATNIYVTASALAGAVDFDTAVTGLSGIIGWASAPADGSISELNNPNIA